MKLSYMAKCYLQCSIDNITITSHTATHGNPQVPIYSDASLTGWGVDLNEDESTNPIDYLEILACFLTLKAFRLDIQNCQV